MHPALLVLAAHAHQAAAHHDYKAYALIPLAVAVLAIIACLKPRRDS